MSALEKVVSGFEIPVNLSLVLSTTWIIISDFAVWSRSPVIIAKYAESKSSLMECNDVVSAILQLSSEAVAVRFSLESDVPSMGDGSALKFFDFSQNLNDEQYFYRMFFKKNRAIWFIDSLKSFRRLEADLMNERWHYERNGYFCIIYTGREGNRLQTIGVMFQRLFSIYVINVIVLAAVHDMVLVYTYYPFAKARCFNTEPILFNYYGPTTNYSFNKPYLFPKKLSNMGNCPLVVTTWTAPPFMIVENDQCTGELKRLSGIEGMLMMLLSEQMNFTMQIVAPPDNDRGYVLPNGTTTGATKMLVDQNTNISIVSMIYDKIRADRAQAAISYMTAPLNLGIPKGKPMSPFERILHPFKYIIWSSLSSSLIIAVLIIFTLKAFFKSSVQAFVFGPKNRTPFTNLWNVFFGGALHNWLPRRNFARYILAIWMFYSMVLRTAYIGQLFTILQDSRARSSVNTVNEVIARNFTFYTFPSLVAALNNAAESDIELRFIDTDKYSLSKLFKKLTGDEDANMAVTLLGHVFRAYNQQEQDHEYRINILKEPLFMAPLTFYMPKHSYLATEINEIILNIMSAGLMSKFEELYIEPDSYFTYRSKEPSKITVKLLSGLFSIYMGLLFLCTLIFLLELWSKKSPLTKKFVDFLNC